MLAQLLTDVVPCPPIRLYASTCAPFISAENALNVVRHRVSGKVGALLVHSHDAMQPRAVIDVQSLLFAQHQLPFGSESNKRLCESCRSKTGGLCAPSPVVNIGPALAVSCVAAASAVFQLLSWNTFHARLL